MENFSKNKANLFHKYIQFFKKISCFISSKKVKIYIYIYIIFKLIPNLKTQYANKKKKKIILIHAFMILITEGKIELNVQNQTNNEPVETILDFNLITKKRRNRKSQR